MLGVVATGAMTYLLSWFPVYKRYGIGIWKINKANGIILAWIAVILVILLSIFLKDWRQEENHIDFEILLWGMCYVCINVIGLSLYGAPRLAFTFLLFWCSCLHDLAFCSKERFGIFTLLD